MCAGSDPAWASAIINKVAPHVPVSAPVVRVSPAVTDSLVKINVSSAKLLTRFLTSTDARVHLRNPLPPCRYMQKQNYMAGMNSVSRKKEFKADVNSVTAALRLPLFT